ncbi:NUDIX domain-containing protein [Candidatus Dojkabacteria bacterium]|uniref:NUDIX domain-containing protein n=1 Tax=Candidatus Dojkabacteria bacterium TaxID=2099670 RepID=A0A955L8C2_9BACT|nr:NUDIX domain-containing protein [Candidatus Dojkabacteria bacterium]
MSLRYKVLSAVYVALLKDNKVVLARRYNTGYQDGNYTLPAGHIDEGETALEAGIREVEEEVGVKVSPEHMEFFHVTHRNSIDGKVYIDFYFTAKEWEGEVQNMEQEKCDDVRWFGLYNLPDNILPDVQMAMVQLKSEIYYSEVGWK